MKPLIRAIYIQSKKLSEFENLDQMYITKIKPLCEINLTCIKAYSGNRKDKENKKQQESQKILEQIEKEDFVILCDENGKEMTSHEFSKDLSEYLEIQKKVIFVIGGSYGVSDKLKQRSNLKLKLSSFVFNHHIAKVVLLEQIYRGLTLIKGIPYHND